jgi:streptogramin lyase
VTGLSCGTENWSGVTAMDSVPDGTLIIAVGSSKNGAEDWQRDLLDGERSGSVWRLDPKTGQARQLAAKLAYPNGVVVEADGNIIVSEAWQKRLVRLSPDGRLLGQVMEDLPGYPARLSRSARGGYWLSIFAPRSPLIEFVLREPAYRKAMMAEVAPEFWIAPALRSGRSFREPMQGGALKQMGILKPWAPTRSYGLVVELDAAFVPLRSFHSRAGGKRHGVTSAVEAGGKLWATARGGDEVVAIDLGTEGV